MTAPSPAAKRAVIYARYSSALQSDRSIDDQVALCRRHAEAQGLQVLGSYEDRARSGGSIAGRDGLDRLLADAAAGRFDVVVVEQLDRISRDLEDIAHIFKRLRFLGVAIEEVHGGRAGTLQVSLRGLVGALYTEDLANKVRRGHAGRVREGRRAGGKPYGYRPIDGRPGETAIDAEQANVVRRVFAEFVAGARPREIAAGLNRDRVPPPRGARWNASTVGGNKARGNGILRNEIYAGRLVWNRLRMVRDPATGKRVSRLNPAGERQVVDVPQLAIVDPATWSAAQAILASRGAGGPPHLQRRPRRLLSGLLRCGCCGGGMGVHDTRRHETRIRCTRRAEAGDCDNRRTYRADRIERLVLDGLAAHLRDPRLIREYVATYRAERRRLAQQRRADRGRNEQRLAQLAGEIDRAVEAYIKGTLPLESIEPRVQALQAEKKAVEADLAALPPDDVVDLHPHAVTRYLAQIDSLAAELDGAGAEALRSREILRELIERVTIHPVGDDGFEIEISGRLAALLGPGAMPQGRIASPAWGKDGSEGMIQPIPHHVALPPCGPVFTIRIAA